MSEGWRKVFPRGDESPMWLSELRNTAHGALIKSPSGCRPRKQIAVIIPKCRPLTACSIPQLQAPFRPLRTLQTEISLLLPVMCHRSRRRRCSSLPFALRARFHHCDVSTVCRRGWEDGKLSDLHPHQSGARHTAAAVWLRDHTENTLGAFPDLWPHSWLGASRRSGQQPALLE